MEEMRIVAMSYYESSPIEIKFQAEQFFREMDVDRNGSISFQEFACYVQTRCSEWLPWNPNLFTELDTDGDGSLDFGEVIVLFYMLHMRRFFCGACGEHLKGCYFSCVECFSCSNRSSYDLCPACYRKGIFKVTHGHQVFLDNNAMMWWMKQQNTSRMGGNQAVVPYHQLEGDHSGIPMCLLG